MASARSASERKPRGKRRKHCRMSTAERSTNLACKTEACATERIVHFKSCRHCTQAVGGRARCVRHVRRCPCWLDVSWRDALRGRTGRGRQHDEASAVQAEHLQLQRFRRSHESSCLTHLWDTATADSRCRCRQHRHSRPNAFAAHDTHHVDGVRSSVDAQKNTSSAWAQQSTASF